MSLISHPLTGGSSIIMIRGISQRRLASLTAKLTQSLEEHISDKKLFSKIKTSKVPKKFVTAVNEYKYKKEGFSDAKEFKKSLLSRAGFSVSEDDALIHNSVSKIAEIAAASADAQKLNISDFKEWLQKEITEPIKEDVETTTESQPTDKTDESQPVGEHEASLEGIKLEDIEDYDDNMEMSEEDISTNLPDTGPEADISIELPEGLSLENIDAEAGYTPDPDTEQTTETLSETLSEKDVSSAVEQPYFIKRDPKVVTDTAPDKLSIRRSAFFSRRERLKIIQQPSTSYTVKPIVEPDVEAVVVDEDEMDLFVVDPEQPLDGLFYELSTLLHQVPSSLTSTYCRTALNSFITLSNDVNCDKPKQLSNIIRSLAMARFTNKGGAEFDLSRPLGDLIYFSVYYGREIEQNDPAILRLHGSKDVPVVFSNRATSSSFPSPSSVIKENITKLSQALNSAVPLTQNERAHLIAGLTPYIGDLLNLLISQLKRSIKKLDTIHSKGSDDTTAVLLCSDNKISKLTPQLHQLKSFDNTKQIEETEQSIVSEGVTVSRISSVRQAHLVTVTSACQGSWFITDGTSQIFAIQGMRVYRIIQKGEKKESVLVSTLKFIGGEVRMTFKRPDLDIASNYILEAVWPVARQSGGSRERPGGRERPLSLRWYSPVSGSQSHSMTYVFFYLLICCG